MTKPIILDYLFQSDLVKSTSIQYDEEQQAVLYQYVCGIESFVELGEKNPYLAGNVNSNQTRTDNGMIDSSLALPEIEVSPAPKIRFKGVMV